MKTPEERLLQACLWQEQDGDIRIDPDRKREMWENTFKCQLRCNLQNQ